MFKIYTKNGCPSCVWAKELLSSKGLDFSEVDVMGDDDAMTFFLENNFRTVPQIYHNNTHIGGFDQLRAYLIEKSL